MHRLSCGTVCLGVGYERDEHVIVLNCENASWPRRESLLVLYFRLDHFPLGPVIGGPVFHSPKLRNNQGLLRNALKLNVSEIS